MDVDAEAPLSAQHILEVVKRKGLLARRDGLEALNRQLENESRKSAALRTILDKVVSYIERNGISTNFLDANIVRTVIVEETRQDADVKNDSLQVVSAFEQPKYKLDTARKVYRLAGTKFPLHGDPLAKTSIHEERLATAHDRLMRHPNFAPPLPGSKKEYVALSKIDELPMSASSHSASVLFGVLIQPEDGLWALEDSAGRSVVLDLSHAQSREGMLTETSIVLVSGVYDSEGYAPGFEPSAAERAEAAARSQAGSAGGGGVAEGAATVGTAAYKAAKAAQGKGGAVPQFLTEGRIGGVLRVQEIAHPPPEPRPVSLDSMALLDPFGAFHTPAERDRVNKIMQETAQEAMMVVLSDVHLDKASVLDGIRTILRGFHAVSSSEGDAAIPCLFILMGNFASRPFGHRPGDKKAYQANFAALRSVFLEYPEISSRTHVVLVPGPTDPGSAPVLPRPPLPTCFCQSLLDTNDPSMPKVTLASNPCRIRFFTREIVVFRHEVTTRLRRRAVLPPVAPIPLHSGQEEAGEYTVVTGEEESSRGTADSSSPYGPLVRAALAWPATRHAAVTVALQAHLLPLPLSLQPLYWAHDHALRLQPMPHAIIVGEEQEPYDHVVRLDGSPVPVPDSTGTGGQDAMDLEPGQYVRVFNPGSFSTSLEFAAYRPVTGMVEPSTLEPQDLPSFDSYAEGMLSSSPAEEQVERGGQQGYEPGQEVGDGQVEMGNAEDEMRVNDSGVAEDGEDGQGEADEGEGVGGLPYHVPSSQHSQPTVLSDGSILGRDNPYKEEDKEAFAEDDEGEGGEGLMQGSPKPGPAPEEEEHRQPMETLDEEVEQ